NPGRILARAACRRSLDLQEIKDERNDNDCRWRCIRGFLRLADSADRESEGALGDMDGRCAAPAFVGVLSEHEHWSSLLDFEPRWIRGGGRIGCVQSADFLRSISLGRNARKLFQDRSTERLVLDAF